jgi:hypothetical protein
MVALNEEQEEEEKEHGRALADAIEATLPAWVERSVQRRLEDAGRRPSPEVREAAAAAGRQAVAEVAVAVRALLEADIDEQATTPLALLRAAVRFPTSVLEEAGVPHVARDEVQERLLPDDVYDLAPASFADVDPMLAEPGLVWGAAKAYAHIQRHGRSAQ